jgi:hypothetical protein
MVSVSFSDSANVPPSISSNSTAFSNAAAFHLENSYGLKALSADYYGPIRVNVTGCDTAGIRDQVNQALGLSNYDVLIYALAYRGSCNWTGLTLNSSSTAPRVYTNGTSSIYVLAHELGHSYGLDHSASLDCGALSTGASCTFIEYGDKFDVMAKALYHMNAYQKMRLGVLAPFVVSVSGQYTLFPVEFSPSAIKVLKSIDAVTGDPTYYYAEYRQPLGYDSGIGSSAGVLIHQGTEFQDSFNLFFSYLLDTTPETSSWSDAALGVGHSFYDAGNRIKISTVSADSNQAVVDVAFDSEPPPTPTPSPTPVPTPSPTPLPCSPRGNSKQCH